MIDGESISPFPISVAPLGASSAVARRPFRTVRSDASEAHAPSIPLRAYRIEPRHTEPERSISRPTNLHRDDPCTSIDRAEAGRACEFERVILPREFEACFATQFGRGVHAIGGAAVEILTSPRAPGRDIAHDEKLRSDRSQAVRQLPHRELFSFGNCSQLAVMSGVSTVQARALNRNSLQFRRKIDELNAVVAFHLFENRFQQWF